jgi:predicted Zn-ribbon and HTH transcriptional regulator
MALGKKLKCKKCGYSFHLKGDSNDIPFRCPYCAKEGTIIESRHILEDL